jgi:hypothetical protein
MKTRAETNSFGSVTLNVTSYLKCALYFDVERLGYSSEFTLFSNGNVPSY